MLRRDPAGVVVQRGDIAGGRRRAIGADGEGDRRELTLPEGIAQPVEGSARRDVRREDARVRRVEADVEERRTQHQQEGEGRDEDRDRMAHDPPGEARPRAVLPRFGRDPADREPVEVRPDDRFVDSGEIITAAGVSAGIDMALHLVARLHSVERAREVRRYIQYDPEPPV